MTSPSNQQTITIGIVDDHPLTRFALRSVIEGEAAWRVTVECASPTELLRQLQLQQPDVLLVDLSFGDGCGMELLETMRGDFPDVKALVYSARVEQEFATRCFRLGAVGFVSKEEPLTQVREAIKTVARGYMYVSDRLTNSLMDEFASASEVLG